MNRPAADRIGIFVLGILLAVAFASGGGGSRYAIANLAVQLTALAALALRPAAGARFWRESPLLLRILIVLSLALPVAQIVPLPEALWAALPGHDLAASSFAAAGTTGWTTWSLVPLRTALAWTALVTPLAVVMAGWTLPRHHLLSLAWLVVGFGLVTALMGLFQLNPAGDNFVLFPAREPGAVLLGTFANRNSTALFLVFCLALACLLPTPREHPAVPWLRLGAALLLAVAIILTKSRTGLVLGAIPLGLAALKGWAWLLERNTGRRASPRTLHPIVLAIGALALGTSLIGGIYIAAPERITETLERFEAKDDPRRVIWEDGDFAARRYWPAGAGMGAFDEVFQIDESLENVTLRTAGRAHNDYLELAIEAGLPGVTLAGLWIALCIFMAIKARHAQIAWAGWAGGTFLLAIALQSVTDYPLRNQTILAFAGLALLLLARAARPDGEAGR